MLGNASSLPFEELLATIPPDEHGSKFSGIRTESDDDRSTSASSFLAMYQYYATHTHRFLDKLHCRVKAIQEPLIFRVVDVDLAMGHADQ